MPEHRTSAMILNLKDFGEIDRIVTFYTSDFGKISGIAKGARKSQKRFGAALDFFSHVDLSFFVRETMGMVRINHCQLLHAFPSLHEDIVRMGYGSYIAELMTEMTAEGVANKELFETLVRFFLILDTYPLKEDFLHIFEMRLLNALGYRPCLDRCTHCKNDFQESEVIRFSISRGGAVCSRCNADYKNLYPVSAGTLKLLQQSCILSLDKIQRLVFSSQALEESRVILPRFIQYHIEKELRTLKFIDKMREPIC